MGTWAEGNFDNDGSLDYLAGLNHQLTTAIEEVLADQMRVRLDEDGEAILMPSVEILALLCERYNAAPPKETTVQQWRKKYLQVFDKQIDGLQPKADFKTRRRRVIDHTFEWLEGLARSYWQS